MEVRELDRGNLFKMTHQVDCVYERKHYLDDGRIAIVRVAYYMDGRWIIDKESGEEACNPHCDTFPVTMSFLRSN